MTRAEMIARLEELVPGLVDTAAASDRELAQVLADLEGHSDDRFAEFEPALVERAS